MKNVIVSLVALAGVAGIANAQVQQEPIGATLTYQVALPGGAWGSSVNAPVGTRVEWRAVLNFTGTQAAAALGRIYYQPVFSNTDNAGGTQDQLGAWRNGGASGQGNTTLALGLLSAAEGNNSSSLADYGRVVYGFTSRSTTAGSSGALTGIRHNGDNGAPAGSYIRIAGTNNTSWYPASIPNGSVALNNQILWGVVSDNNTATSTWFATGTQGVVIFRQAFIVGDQDNRTISLNSEAATLQRAGGSSGTDDTRFMTWAAAGEGGSTATIRAGVSYVGATINVPAIPAPGAVALLGLGGLVAGRRRRA
ncbi:MAG: hypothetical protein U0640_15080 [Phycisphaerales bacterium]